VTVTLDGNGFAPFDEATISTDAASVTIDISDDSNQNICLVMGSVGADTDNAFGRMQLLDSGSSAITNVRGNTASLGVTNSTIQLTGDVFTTNYYGLGNASSDSSIAGERMQLMTWIQASQNASEPFYDVVVRTFSTQAYTNNNVFQSSVGLYFQGTAVPRKLKFYFSSGNISTASLKSYIIGGN